MQLKNNYTQKLEKYEQQNNNEMKTTNNKYEPNRTSKQKEKNRAFLR